MSSTPAVGTPATPPLPPGWPGAPAPPRRGLTIAAAIVTGLWVVGVTTTVQGVGWLFDQLLLLTGFDFPAVAGPVIGWIGAAIAAAPALALMLVPKLEWARATGRLWLLCTLLGGGLGSARFVSPDYHELYLAVLLLIIVFAVLVARAARHARPAEGPALTRTAALYTIAAGVVVLIPWLWLGALGGPLEALLALAVAGAFGWLVAVIVPRPGPLPAPEPGHRWGRAMLDGLALGVAMCGLAAGVGEPGNNLYALLVLPMLGMVAAAAGRRGIGVLAAFGVLGPLALIDTEELSIVLAAPVTPLVTAGAAFAVAVLLFLGYVVLLGRARRLDPWLPLTCVVLAVVGAVAAYLGPGHPGLHNDRVFVVMRQHADLSGLAGIEDRDQRLRQTYQRLVETADTSQREIRAALRDRGLAFTPYYLVNGLEVDGGPVVRAWLARRSDVDRVLLNPVIRPSIRPGGVMRGDPEDAPAGTPWNITAIHADRVWSELGVTGRGIVVGGSDSGADGAHPELRDGFRGGDDSWRDLWYDTAEPTDHNGHGTHTLSTAVGRRVGVAPGAQWTACVNLGMNLGNPARYIGCLQYMFAPHRRGADPLREGRPERAPHVLTNSWGCTELEGCDAGALRQAVDVLAAAGVFAVFAAGNTGPFCGSLDDPPAFYGTGFTVGSVNRRTEVSLFSSRGPAPGGASKPDLTAPGEKVVSALPGGGYGELDGTSMAAPHVAGVVALMWSANPALIGDVERTADILRRTAAPAKVAPTDGDDDCGPPANSVGAGIVDAYAAVTAARAATA